MKNVECREPWTDRKEVASFIREPYVYRVKSKYVQKLTAQYGSMMTAFPDFDDNAVNAILDYIKNESKRQGAEDDEITMEGAKSGAPIYKSDSTSLVLSQPCSADTIYKPIPKSEQSFFDNSIQSDYPSAPDTVPVNPDNKPAKAETMEGLREGFTDSNPTSGMYDFQIKTLGWYNVDAEVEGYAGTKNVTVLVEPKGITDVNLHVYLFCPENKTLSVSNERKGSMYGFNKIDNKIPLFINSRALLFAFGSKGGSVYYGIKEFIIKDVQTILVDVKETTTEELQKAITARQLDGIDLGIEKKEEVIIERLCDESKTSPDTAYYLQPK
jgi:hypothetical protein